MNQPSSTKRAIRQQVVPVGVAAFEGDLFDRKKLAERLTNSIGMLTDGGAIAIDGPWGSGKTWFAKNWKLQLERTSEVVYIDAFAMDYVDDPFLMIAGELLSVAKTRKPDSVRSLLKKSSQVAKALLPIGAKVVTGLASKYIGEVASEEIAEGLTEAVDGAGGLIEKRIERKLAEYDSEKQSATAYREALAALAAQFTTPIVVFVDELDRCRPDFAVRTIERIKHFFEVKGVVFVLLVNRQQLCASIRGAYGQDLDADSYLRKFLLFSLRLPEISSNSNEAFNVIYCFEVLRAYGLPDTKQAADFAQEFGTISAFFDFQFRDVERAVALFALAPRIGGSAHMVAWAIALKLWRPALFARLQRGERSAHVEVLKQFEGRTFDESIVARPALTLHAFHSNGFSSPPSGDELQQLLAMTGVADPKRMLAAVFEKIDLSVS